MGQCKFLGTALNLESFKSQFLALAMQSNWHDKWFHPETCRVTPRLFGIQAATAKT